MEMYCAAVSSAESWPALQSDSPLRQQTGMLIPTEISPFSVSVSAASAFVNFHNRI